MIAELTFVISIGFIVCMTICIPFGYLNLDDNMWFQWFSLAGLCEFQCQAHALSVCVLDVLGEQILQTVFPAHIFAFTLTSSPPCIAIIAITAAIFNAMVTTTPSVLLRGVLCAVDD